MAGDTPPKLKREREAKARHNDSKKKRKAREAARHEDYVQQRKLARATAPAGDVRDADPGTTPPLPQPAQPPALPDDDPARASPEQPAARLLDRSPGAAGPSGQLPETPAAAGVQAARGAPRSAPPAPSTSQRGYRTPRARRRSAQRAANAQRAAAEAAEDEDLEERRRSARRASDSAPAEPEPRLAERTLREYSRWVLEYMETLATPRGADGPRQSLLDDLHCAVSARLGAAADARTGWVSPTIVANIKEFLGALAPKIRSELPYSVRLFVMAACCGSDIQLVELAEALGVNRNALSKAKALREQFMTSGDLSHAPRGNGGNRNHISVTLRRRIWDFWLDETRPSPCRADNTHKVRAKDFDGNALAEPTVKHIQSLNDRAMYDQYCEDFGHPGVSKTTFCKVGYCKPGWVRRMPLHQRLVCLSTKDLISQRMVASMKANVRRAYPNGVPDCTSCPANACGCVKNILHSTEFLHRFANRMLCPLDKDTGATFNNLACVDGDCLECGWEKKIGRCPHLYSNKPATWKT